MADDEKCIEVGKFVWKYHESVGWYDADEDDPAMDTEIALLDEIERLRAADQYVEDLGVDWCVLHHGVRNEDSDRCDAFDWADGDDMLDEDGEYLPCDLRPLAYREASRG